MDDDRDGQVARDSRLAKALILTVALLVLVWAAWGPIDRALFPEHAARADCEAHVFFNLVGGVKRGEPGYEAWYEDVVAPAIERCVGERLSGQVKDPDSGAQTHN